MSIFSQVQFKIDQTNWFKDNRMVANPKKFQVMFLGLKQHQEFFLEIENKSIDVTRSVKLLGISVDDELKFDKHVKTLCQKVSRKVSAFSRVQVLSTCLDVLR